MREKAGERSLDVADASSAAGYTIGDWQFVPAEDELRRGEERRKLEHRAARTLELLCRQRGALVPREAILDAVWQGRAVSANSVAIVVSDLREAIGDSARDPAHIETVAKRGYRLRAAAGATESRSWRPPGTVAMIAAAMLLVVVAIAAWRLLAPAPVRLAVAEVTNETGSAAYSPLAKASSAVLLDAAQRWTGASVSRAGAAPRGAVLVQARLILWSGRPTLMMSATDANGRVFWGAYSRGGEDNIPADVSAAMHDLHDRLKARAP